MAATTEKLREWKQDQPGLLQRFDNNRDGKLDEAQWDAVHDVTANESQARTLRSGISRESVICQLRDGSPLRIAAPSSLQREHRDGRFGALYFLIALAGVIGSLRAIGQATQLAVAMH